MASRWVTVCVKVPRGWRELGDLLFKARPASGHAQWEGVGWGARSSPNVGVSGVGVSDRAGGSVRWGGGFL